MINKINKMANDSIGDIWFEMNMGGTANKNAEELFRRMQGIVAFAKEYTEIMKGGVSVGKDMYTPFLKNYEKAAQMLTKVNDLIQKANSEIGRASVFGGNVGEIEKSVQALKKAREELTKGLSGGRVEMIATDQLSAFEAKIRTIEGNLKSVGKEINSAIDSKKLGNKVESTIIKMSNDYNRLTKGMFGVDDKNNAVYTSADNLLDKLIEVQNRLNSAAKSGNVSEIQKQLMEYDALSKKIDQVAKSLKNLNAEQRSRSNAELNGNVLLQRIDGRMMDLNKAFGIANKGGLQEDIQNITSLMSKLESFKQRLNAAVTANNTNEIGKLAKEYKLLSVEISNATKSVIDNSAAQRNNIEQAKQRLSVAYGRSFELGSSHPIDNILNRMDQLNEKASMTKDIFNQLKNQMALTFMTVYGVEALVKEVITIGGEFERQHKALQVILGDMQQADALYGQLKNLAMESPFTFKDLATYSKQLAAFSIPYKELFDTTNRLSDMSAGLGVDMNRLILAYGQVRSATVLRGQELRQFTEAGVPMVQKLADYFTKLNGKVVDTSEIFTMISKRQVPFEAVKSVIEEMTSKGGEFYQMQEKIADTLSGRFINLKDAWQVMLSSFADGKTVIGTTLKEVIQLTTSIIRNVNLITSAIIGFGAMKLVSKTGIGSAMALRQDSSYDYGTGYMKAKQLEAVAAQRRIVMAEMLRSQGLLTKEQEQQLKVDRMLVGTRKQMTRLDWEALVSAGKLNKWQIARLASEQKITKEKAKQALLAQGLSGKEADKVLGSKLGGRIAGKMKDFGSELKDSFKSLFSAPNLIFAGIGVAVSVISNFVQEAAERTRQAKQVIEEAESQRKDLQKFLDANSVGISADPEEAKRAYEKFTEELYKQDPNAEAFLIKLKLDYGDDLQQQAIKVRERLNEELTIKAKVTDIGDERINDIFDSSRHWWTDSYETNVKEFLESESKLEKELQNLPKGGFEKIITTIETYGDKTSKSAAESAKKIFDATKDIRKAGKELFNSMSNSEIRKFFYGSNYGLMIPQVRIEEWKQDMETAKENAAVIAEELKKALSVQSGEITSSGEVTDIGRKIVMDIANKMADNKSLSGSQKSVFVNAIMDNLGFNSEEIGVRISQMIETSIPDINSLVRTNPAKAKEQIDEFFNTFLRTFQLSHGVYNVDLQNYVNAHPLQILQAIYVKYNLADGQNQAKKRLEDFLKEKFGETVYVAAQLDTVADVTEAIKKVQEYQKKLQEKVGLGAKVIGATVGIKFDISSGFEAIKKKLESWMKSADKKSFGYMITKQLLGWVSDIIDSQSGLKKLNVEPETVRPKSITPSTRKTTARKEDKELKKARKWLEEYRKFWNDLESKREQYGTSAFGLIKKSGLYNDLLNFIGENNAQDFSKSINIIVKSLGKLSSEERKAFSRQGKEEISRNITKQETKDISDYNKFAKKKIELLNEQYEIYKKLYLVTGDAKGSALLAGREFANKSVLDYMREELSDAIGKYNKGANTNYTVSDILGMSDEKFDKVIGKSSYIAELRTDYLNKEKKLRQETLDLAIEALSKEFEIEEKIQNENRKYEERKKLLEDAIKTEEDAKKKGLLNNALTNLNKEHFQKLADLYIQQQKRNIGWDAIFGNIGNASSAILGKVKDLIKDMLKNPNLSPESAKSLVDAMTRIEKELINRNPFQTIIDAFKGGRMSQEQRYGLQEYLSQNYKKSYTLDEATAKQFGLKAGTYTRKQLEEVAYTDNTKNFTDAVSAVEKDFKALHDILSPVLNLLDSLGVDVGLIGDVLSAPGNALNAAVNTAGSFGTLSNVFNKNGKLTDVGQFLSDAAPYAAGAVAGLSLVTSLFQLHDKALQKEIEASERRQREMTNLTDSLKKVLERTLGGVYNTKATDKMLSKFDKYDSPKYTSFIAMLLGNDYLTKDTRNAINEARDSKSYFDASYASLMVQRDEMQHQLELEQQKKKKDRGKIEDYKKQIEELDDAIHYFAIDMAKELYSIDVQEWAKQLSDSIVDAWANGEDALLAYKRTLNDLMKSMTKNIITKTIMETAFKPVQDLVAKEMTDKDGKLTADSITRISDLLLTEGQKAFDNIYGLLDYLKQRGVDLSDTANGSTIGKGIQAVTEDTANLLASYINAIRADVAINRLSISKISDENLPGISANLGLQLTELRNISVMAERNARASEEIRNLLDSVITTGSNGKKIKV